MEVISKIQRPELLNINIDNVSYDVRLTPIIVNGEKRFVIRINDSADHIYVWDEQRQSLRALDDEVSTIPATLEKAISDKLLHNVVFH